MPNYKKRGGGVDRLYLVGYAMIKYSPVMVEILQLYKDYTR